MKSDFIYRGKVTVKVKNKPPVDRRNKGTTVLFDTIYRIFAQTLTGQDAALPASLPCYMMLVDANMDNIKDYQQVENNKLLSSLMPIVNRVASINDVSFSCLLNHSNILTERVSSTIGDKITILLIDGSDTPHVLAYAPLSKEDIKSVVEDRFGQATITWSMSFNNYSAE